MSTYNKPSYKVYYIQGYKIESKYIKDIQSRRLWIYGNWNTQWILCGVKDLKLNSWVLE